MSDHTPRSSDSSTRPEPEALARLVQTLVDQVAEARLVWDRVERQAIPLLERIALALERGQAPPSGFGSAAAAASTLESSTESEPDFAREVRLAIDEKRWDRAQAILDGSSRREGVDSQVVEALTIELDRSRDRAVADLNDRMHAARVANDVEGALNAHEELTKILHGDNRKEVDRSMISWLMKMIQRRLRTIPVGTDVATLASVVAERFAATPEGASLRAALPTLRRSAGLCPRCSEPYLGVDDACPKCLAAAGQAPTPMPTLTFVEDDLDAAVQGATPVDLNKIETWQLP